MVGGHHNILEGQSVRKVENHWSKGWESWGTTNNVGSVGWVVHRLGPQGRREELGGLHLP